MTQLNIEIPLSKRKIMVALFISLLFVALGFWLVIARPNPNGGNAILGNPILIVVVGLAAIVFFGMGILVLIRKLKDKRPGLIVSDEGILDNASGVAAGVIPWADIQKIKLAQVMSQKFLMLIVKDPEQYIQRETNAIKRKGMELNYKNYGSPISISAGSLQIGFNELQALLMEKWQKHK
ncbi:STM3941 family protein [Niabella sp. 22666]|uniref:STM3941 family protein n=1 Tax=Niabella sp. 22666 TaxID=3453954 RepID=UPI003F85F7FE